jgi:hypothetical protein
MGRAPHQGALLVRRGWGVVCMRNIFFLKEIWPQDKIHFGRDLDLFKYEACFIP